MRPAVAGMDRQFFGATQLPEKPASLHPPAPWGKFGCFFPCQMSGRPHRKPRTSQASMTLSTVSDRVDTATSERSTLDIAAVQLSFSRNPSDEKPFLTVRVSEHRTAYSPFTGAYTEYLVETVEVGVLSVVKRRFREFVDLHNKIRDEVGDDASLPEIPQKRTFGRMEPEFVESRQRLLNAYLESLSSRRFRRTGGWPKPLFEFLELSPATAAIVQFLAVPYRRRNSSEIRSRRSASAHESTDVVRATVRKVSTLAKRIIPESSFRPRGTLSFFGRSAPLEEMELHDPMRVRLASTEAQVLATVGCLMGHAHEAKRKMAHHAVIRRITQQLLSEHSRPVWLLMGAFLVNLLITLINSNAADVKTSLLRTRGHLRLTAYLGRLYDVLYDDDETPTSSITDPVKELLLSLVVHDPVAMAEMLMMKSPECVLSDVARQNRYEAMHSFIALLILLTGVALETKNAATLSLLETHLATSPSSLTQLLIEHSSNATARCLVALIHVRFPRTAAPCMDGRVNVKEESTNVNVIGRSVCAEILFSSDALIASPEVSAVPNIDDFEEVAPLPTVRPTRVSLGAALRRVQSDARNIVLERCSRHQELLRLSTSLCALSMTDENLVSKVQSLVEQADTYRFAAPHEALPQSGLDLPILMYATNVVWDSLSRIIRREADNATAIISRSPGQSQREPFFASQVFGTVTTEEERFQFILWLLCLLTAEADVLPGQIGLLSLPKLSRLPIEGSNNQPGLNWNLPRFIIPAVGRLNYVNSFLASAFLGTDTPVGSFENVLRHEECTLALFSDKKIRPVRDLLRQDRPLLRALQSQVMWSAQQLTRELSASIIILVNGLGSTDSAAGPKVLMDDGEVEEIPSGCGRHSIFHSDTDHRLLQSTTAFEREEVMDNITNLRCVAQQLAETRYERFIAPRLQDEQEAYQRLEPIVQKHLAPPPDLRHLNPPMSDQSGFRPLAPEVHSSWGGESFQAYVAEDNLAGTAPDKVGRSWRINGVQNLSSAGERLPSPVTLTTATPNTSATIYASQATRHLSIGTPTFSLTPSYMVGGDSSVFLREKSANDLLRHLTSHVTKRFEELERSRSRLRDVNRRHEELLCLYARTAAFVRSSARECVEKLTAAQSQADDVASTLEAAQTTESSLRKSQMDYVQMGVRCRTAAESMAALILEKRDLADNLQETLGDLRRLRAEAEQVENNLKCLPRKRDDVSHTLLQSQLHRDVIESKLREARLQIQEMTGLLKDAEARRANTCALKPLVNGLREEWTAVRDATASRNFDSARSCDYSISFGTRSAYRTPVPLSEATEQMGTMAMENVCSILNSDWRNQIYQCASEAECLLVVRGVLSEIEDKLPSEVKLPLRGGCEWREQGTICGTVDAFGSLLRLCEERMQILSTPVKNLDGLMKETEVVKRQENLLGIQLRQLETAIEASSRTLASGLDGRALVHRIADLSQQIGELETTAANATEHLAKLETEIKKREADVLSQQKRIDEAADEIQDKRRRLIQMTTAARSAEVETYTKIEKAQAWLLDLMKTNACLEQDLGLLAVSRCETESGVQRDAIRRAALREGLERLLRFCDQIFSWLHDAPPSPGGDLWHTSLQVPGPGSVKRGLK